MDVLVIKTSLFVSVLTISSVMIFAGNHSCGISEFACATREQCIPVDWLCDGDRDCLDASDETDCVNQTCHENVNQFLCIHDSRCIDEIFVCDGDRDCSNGADERYDLCRNRSCRADEFRCEDDHQCIDRDWLCDGDHDCEDGSDEQNCEPKECAENEFKCVDSLNNVMCIPDSWQCDGSADCDDESDERGCPKNHCGIYAFACATGVECIHEAWVCDGGIDCPDGSDEWNCSVAECLHGQFQCRHSGACISTRLVCDGHYQCGGDDTSDELGCVNKPCDSLTEFDCSSDGRGSFCIPVSQVCDGQNNCGRFEDENPSICNRSIVNPCSIGNGGCAHDCIFTHITHYCKCRPGFKLIDDGTQCEDVDECQIPGSCSQLCENRNGSHKCSCHSGYQLDPGNHVTCLATGDEPQLLFGSWHEIRKIGIRSGHYRSVVGGVHRAAMVDFDYARDLVFYSERDLFSIHLKNWSADDGTSVTLSVGTGLIGDIAFDWIHSNLYWTDTSSDRIEVLGTVADSSGHYWEHTLISTGLGEPRALAVDPRDRHRYLFWTDCGTRPKIERAELDGSSESRHEIVTRNIHCPVGLTIDYESDLLFWIDTKQHVVFSSDLNGRKRSILLTSSHFLRHSVAISVFEDFVYWADASRPTGSLYRMRKFRNVSADNNAVTRVAGHLALLTDVCVRHELRQPPANNSCRVKVCSHLCLPKQGYPGFTCACPNPHDRVRYSLDSRRFQCIVTRIPAPENAWNDSYPSSGNSSLSSQSHESGTDRVVGTVIGSVIAVIVIFLAACLCLLRLYRRRNIKSLRFDNPVYRAKGEEDQFTLSMARHRAVSTELLVSSDVLTSSAEHTEVVEQT